jgi:hypothetical protein
MKRIRQILLGLVAAGGAVTAHGAAKYTISAAEVASAMSSTGINVAPLQVTLLSAAVANAPTPQLRVRSIERWNDNRAMVRIECANPAECVPFFVSVRLGAATPTPLSASNPLQVSSQPRAQPESKYAVRVGTPATLFLDGDHVHIRIAVTCLSNGADGETVRAETADHQKSFVAQVAGNGILRGRL